MKLLKKFFLITKVVTQQESDPYHLTFTFHPNHIGYIHLIRANTDTPEIEAFEIAKEYRRLGYGKKLLLYIPTFYRKHGLPLKEIRVKPCATDTANLSQKNVEQIYKKLSSDLQKQQIKLTIYH